MSTTAYRIPEAPEFSPSQVRAWWTMDPTTHMAVGFCPQHRRRMQPSPLDHEYGRQPSCCKCGEWLQTLELVAL